LSYVALSGGENHTVALRSDGTAVAWGHNPGTVPTLPPGVAYVQIAAGGVHSAALRSDGSIVVWGSNQYGQYDVPPLPAGTVYVEVAAGARHCLARRSDGVVVSWGWNYFGQCTLPALDAGTSFRVLAGRESRSFALFGPTCDAVSTVYCTAKVNSLGCTPSMAMLGQAEIDVGHGCALVSTGVEGKRNGLYFHSTVGPQALPYHGGWLCVATPKRHHSLLNSGGASQTCDGVFSEDFNAYIAAGADPALLGGASVWLQLWARDPADPFGDSLSDALTTTLCP
jgi:hypothetical protein